MRGHGTAAVDHAEGAVALAAALGSARHILKTEVIRAAALCSAGALDASRDIADRGLRDAGRLGMIPLQWALASLLADIGSGTHSAAEVAVVRDESADIVRRRGGVWSVR